MNLLVLLCLIAQTVAQVTQASHLQLRPGADPNGKFERLADHAPTTASTIISVQPVNNISVIATSVRFLTYDQQQVEEDGTPAISSASFSAKLSDADVRTFEQMLASKFQLSLTSRYGCQVPSYSCVVIGTLDELNTLAEKVTYIPDAKYNKFLGSERIGTYPPSLRTVFLLYRTHIFLISHILPCSRGARRPQ